MPSLAEVRTLCASTVPSAAWILPRLMRCCSSSARALSGFWRSEAASKTAQREVNASSSANSSTTSPNRRTIGWFMGARSFEFSEFQAANERGRAALRAQRVIEQRMAAIRPQRGGAHARDVVAAVEGEVARQAVGDTAVHGDQPTVVGADEVHRLERDVGAGADQAEDHEHGRERARTAQRPGPASGPLLAGDG